MKKYFIILSFFFFIPFFYARAESVDIYSTAGDGYIHRSAMSWSDTRDWSTGSSDYIGTNASINTYWDTTFGLDRFFSAFDTSILPDNAIISSVQLKFYVAAKYATHNGSYEYAVIMPTTQENVNYLTDNDYDNFVATSWSDHLVILSGITAGTYNTLNFNSAGIENLSLIGYTKIGITTGYDLENEPPPETVGDSGFIVQTSEYAGTSRDPYLTINYTIPETPATGLSATSTLVIVGNSIINSSIDLAKNVFNNYWPYILIISIITAFVLFFSKFLKNISIFKIKKVAGKNNK